MNKDMPEKPWPCIKCRVMMETKDEDHCKCPACGTEVWYDYKMFEEENEIEDLMKEMYVTHKQNPTTSILGGSAAPGGSSSKSKSNRKQLMKKPTTAQLNRQLAISSATPIKRRPGRPKKNNIDNNK